MSIDYVHDEVSHNYVAAQETLPVVFDLFPVSSLLDVGCGIGTWLKVAQDLGVRDVVGVDGDYVDRTMLKIDTKYFHPYNLRQKLSLNRKFDLAMSLEVAEHLPDSSADALVDTLTSHADVVFFSAAIPYQEGQNHINEQWAYYWIEKFRKRNFVLADIIKQKIWDNEKIEWWYRQNSMFFIHADSPLSIKYKTEHFFNAIHPELYLKKIRQGENSLKKLEADIRNGGVLTVGDVFKLLAHKIKRRVTFTR